MNAADYQKRLGERLRAIRAQQSLTLQQVQRRSGGKWKAVVIGSYERGDRAIPVAKLADLAAFYGVPLADLLPPTGTGNGTPAGVDRAAAQSVVIDLRRLNGVQDADAPLETLARFATRIQSARGDYNGRLLTVRSEDVRTLAGALGLAPDDLVDELAARQVLAATG